MKFKRSFAPELVIVRLTAWGIFSYLLGRVAYHAIVFTEQWVRIVAGALG
jgi:hypothetical protein